VSKKKKKSEN